MSLAERVRGLSNYISIIADDAALLEGGRKSRSPAMRKNLSILAKECSELRKQCLEVQKNLPTKTRAPAASLSSVEAVPAVEEIAVSKNVEEAAATPSPQAATPSLLKLKRARTTAPKKSKAAE